MKKSFCFLGFFENFIFKSSLITAKTVFETFHIFERQFEPLKFVLFDTKNNFYFILSFLDMQ